jgi:hypothetical protein
LNSTQQDQEFTKDYKMIRLEEFGTAASWLILLLPYFAFAICLLLESDTGGFKVTKWGPAGGAAFCFGKGQKDTAVPILPTPPDPCIYPFHKLATWQGSSLLQIEQEMSTYAGTRNNTQEGSSMSRGTAFESVSTIRIAISASVVLLHFP